MSIALGALKCVVDDWLGASLDASHVVSHGVHARLGWVDLNDLNESSLTAGELVLPEDAGRFALLNDEGLGVLSVRDHLFDEVWLVDVWLQSWLMEHPSWRKPCGKVSSSHF